MQEPGLYSFADYWQTGLGNPNTITRKGPLGAEYVDLATGDKYRKLNSTASSGWVKNLTAGGSSKVVSESFVDWDTADQIATLTATGLVRATTGNLLHHTYTPGGLILGTVAMGTQTAAIVTAATGLDLTGDQTDNDGYEVFTNFAGASGRPFIVGNDPAFFFECSFTVANVSGSDTLLCGLRRAEVNNGTYTSYADYCAFGWSAAAASAALLILTGLNGTDATTDTTQTLADGIVYNIRIEVSAAGVVTFKHSQGANVVTATPTVTVAHTIDDGDPVIPFFHFLQATAADTGAVVLRKWSAGYQ